MVTWKNFLLPSAADDKASKKGKKDEEPSPAPTTTPLPPPPPIPPKKDPMEAMRAAREAYQRRAKDSRDAMMDKRTGDDKVHKRTGVVAMLTSMYLPTFRLSIARQWRVLAYVNHLRPSSNNPSTKGCYNKGPPCPPMASKITLSR